MKPFLVCMHDASPLYADETRVIVGELAPFVGRQLSFGVVPNWDGEWPLQDHAGYCDLLRDSSDELLLHGYRHRRKRGWGLVSLLAERSDEMNGMPAAETRLMLEQAQCEFATAFDKPAAGFLAPAWQPGEVGASLAGAAGFEFIFGYFSIEPTKAPRIPLATFTWDCGRWRSLGHVGQILGALRHGRKLGVPVLAIHPRDVTRGFLPAIVALTSSLLEAGYQPCMISTLLENRRAQVCV